MKTMQITQKEENEGTAVRYASSSRTSSRQAGFSLVECMISMFLAAIISIGVYEAMLFARTMVVSTSCHSEAEALAMDQLWTMFNMRYEDLVNQPAIQTLAVDKNHPLHLYGGTIRTGIVNEGKWIEILVSVDWNQRVSSGQSMASSEKFSIRRSNTRR